MTGKVPQRVRENTQKGTSVRLTDFAKLLFFNVANPRSPILTDPVVPVMNMLSHFKSLCMIGGDLE